MVIFLYLKVITPHTNFLIPSRQLASEYPYLILDARYEKVRENAVIRSRAVLVAIGIDWLLEAA